MVFAFAAAIFRNAPPSSGRSSGIATAIGSYFVTAALVFSAHAANETADLRPATKAGSFRQSKVIVEVEGKLKLNADGKEVKHLPLKVDGELNYVERVLSQAKSWTDVRLLRSYQSAQAKIRLHESDLTTELRPERRLIAVQSSTKDAVLFSPRGPLTREELDLIEMPASSLALEAILPSGATKIGGQWPLTDTVVSRLLNLEAVSQQDVTCTLDSAKDNVAIVSLSGKVAGAVGGVSSDIELKGKLNFDLTQRAVTWLTLAVKENRAIGHAQPGFDVLTKLRMVSAPTTAVDELGDKALTALSLQPDATQTLVDLNSDAGGFQLLHNRRWSVMLERGDLAVLRLVDRGDLIAQCNITPLAPLAKDQQLSMDGFQQDVKRVLGKNFEEMTEATEEVGENGLRALRIVVTGTVGELPIQWTYYHLSDDAGRRASLVFTLETSLLSRFGHIDRDLIANFRFVEGKEPTAAQDAQTTPQERETAADKTEIRR